MEGFEIEVKPGVEFELEEVFEIGALEGEGFRPLVEALPPSEALAEKFC
jgi:hypothetical protein